MLPCRLVNVTVSNSHISPHPHKGLNCFIPYATKFSSYLKCEFCVLLEKDSKEVKKMSSIAIIKYSPAWM